MPKVPPEELAKTPEFQRLTQKQKLFVYTYCSNDYDLVNAVRTAYLCKNDEVARIMSYRLLSAINVAMCLSVHFGDTPIEGFLNVLERCIRSGKITSTQIKAFQLYAELQGWRRRLRIRKDETISFEKAEALAQVGVGVPLVRSHKRNTPKSRQRTVVALTTSGSTGRLPDSRCGDNQGHRKIG